MMNALGTEFIRFLAFWESHRLTGHNQLINTGGQVLPLELTIGIDPHDS
jgi:hypothetical protein